MLKEVKKTNNPHRFSSNCSKKINLSSLNSKPKSIIKTPNQEKIEKFKEQKKIDLISCSKILTDYHYEILINELKKPIIKFAEIKNDLQPDTSENKSLDSRYKKKRNTKLISLILKQYIKVQQYAKLNHLGEEFIKVLAHLGTYEHFEKGSPIYKLHSKSSHFYFVIRGCVSIKSIDPDKIMEEMCSKENEYKVMTSEIETDEQLQKFFDNYYKENFDKISLKNSIIDSDNNNKILDETNFDINNNFFKIDRKKTSRNSTNMNLNYNQRSSVFERIKKNLDNDINQKERIAKKKLNTEIFNKNLVELQKNLGCELKIIQKGNFFGEWDLILNRPHINIAFAKENTDLLLLSKNYFDKFLANHLSKADLDRKYFIMNRIPLLSIEHLLNMHPEFYDKNTIIYTQYDIADEFFIILQGKGALKKLNNCKCKQDILNNKNEMETLCIIDSGGIVGLEAGKQKIGKYENNFIITEENTALYRIPLAKNKSKFCPSFRYDLKEFLRSLYRKQYKIIEKRKKDVENYKKNRKIEKSSENKKRENLLNYYNNVFFNSKNKIKCNNIINLKTQIFNFFTDDIKNDYIENSKMSKIKLLKEYYCHSNKQIKVQKQNKIFLTNIKKREKKILEKNANSFDSDYYDAKNIFNITPLKDEKISNRIIKTENKHPIKSANFIRKKDEKRQLTTPYMRNYYKLTGSDGSFSRQDKDKKNSFFMSNLSKITSDTGTNSNINSKNNFIIKSNKYIINKTSYYLVNKLKRKNLENKTQIIPSITRNNDSNKIISNTETFNMSVFRSKINNSNQ